MIWAGGSQRQVMVMIDEPESCGEHRKRSAPSERRTETEAIEPPDELTDWLQAVDPDPANCHFVEVVQEPAPGHGNQIVRLVATCTCGWWSGEHQLYLGASTRWAEERARHQPENAGIAHIRSLSTPSS